MIFVSKIISEIKWHKNSLKIETQRTKILNQKTSWTLIMGIDFVTRAAKRLVAINRFKIKVSIYTLYVCVL